MGVTIELLIGPPVIVDPVVLPSPFTGKSAYEVAVDEGYEGTAAEWLISLIGAPGEEVEFQKTATHIQWKYTDDVTWTNLVALSEIKGEDGYTPVKGVDYDDGADGYTPVKGVDYFDGDPGYTPIKGVDYFDGEDGADGHEIELQKGLTQIQWKYTTDAEWIDLISIAELEASVTKENVEAVLTGEISSHTHAADTTKANLLIQVPSLTLLSASWVLVSGLYKYDLSNANILATSVVDVIPDNADIATVIAAEIYPKTLASAGSVKMYAKYAPTANIGVTINIY